MFNKEKAVLLETREGQDGNTYSVYQQDSVSFKTVEDKDARGRKITKKVKEVKPQFYLFFQNGMIYKSPLKNEVISMLNKKSA